MVNELAQKLYEAHHVGIFRYALSILKDPAAAEDVTQETFVRLLTSGIRYTPGKEQAWLYKVARNLCVDLLRTQKRESGPRQAPAAPQESRWAYIEMLSCLTPKDREIISLKIIGGFTHREIAGILGLTVHGTKKRYERAIRTLRQEMEEIK